MAGENLIDEVVDTKVVPPAAPPAADPVAPPVGDAVVPPTGDAVVPPAAAPVDKAPVVADWPADWRDKAAGGDATKAARLARYASPQALTDALISAQNKIRAGELKPVLGKDAKPEDVAEFREAHGIPEAPDKYDLGELTVPDAEKPMVDKFLTTAHANNMTPEQVRAALLSYTEMSEAARNSRASQDVELATAAEDALRAEWGQEYRVNLNLMSNMLDIAPEGLREKLLRGRLSDGTPIGSSPEALKFLVGLARERNPTGVVVPSGVVSAQSVTDEIQKIENAMRADRAAYNRDETMQARYRQLLNWREAQGKAA